MRNALDSLQRNIFHPWSGRSGLKETVAYLESLDATLNCATVKAGDYICTSGLAANCANTADVAAGTSCADVANQNNLSLGQLIGLNTQLSSADCSFPHGGSACLAAPPSPKVQTLR